MDNCDICKKSINVPMFWIQDGMSYFTCNSCFDLLYKKKLDANLTYFNKYKGKNVYKVVYLGDEDSIFLTRALAEERARFLGSQSTRIEVTPVFYKEK